MNYENSSSHELIITIFLCRKVQRILIHFIHNRAITNDENAKEVDEGPLTSAKIVDSIRNIMNDTHYVSVPIQAYIIPSVDAHQVSTTLKLK